MSDKWLLFMINSVGTKKQYVGWDCLHCLINVLLFFFLTILKHMSFPFLKSTKMGKPKLNTTDPMYFMVNLLGYGLLCPTYGMYIAFIAFEPLSNFLDVLICPTSLKTLIVFFF